MKYKYVHETLAEPELRADARPVEPFFSHDDFFVCSNFFSILIFDFFNSVLVFVFTHNFVFYFF